MFSLKSTGIIHTGTNALSAIRAEFVMRVSLILLTIFATVFEDAGQIRRNSYFPLCTIPARKGEFALDSTKTLGKLFLRVSSRR